MREIALDTETTGLDPKQGHRVIEIGCVEMVDKVRTGVIFHTYLNPLREVPEDAFRIHGISSEFLQDKPYFDDKVDEFLAFLEDSPLVIHNAAFDMKFINFELERVGKQAIKATGSRIIDTLIMARKKFPGSPASLDALCKKYKIDLSSRTKHGALLDAELLSDVYIELIGGSQSVLVLGSEQTAEVKAMKVAGKKLRPSRNFTVPVLELDRHRAYLQKIKDPLWNH